MNNKAKGSGPFTARELFAIVVLAYLDAGGLLGFILQQNGPDKPACWPHVSVFGVLETNCASSLAGWFWFFAAELPRMILVFPALAIAMIRAGIRNGSFGGSYFLESIPWVLYSIPLLLVIWLGISSWPRRTAKHGFLLALGLAVIFVLEAGHLGWGD